MRFGHIDSYLLFGGGQVLFNTCLEIFQKGYNLHVITSHRHASSEIDYESKRIPLVKALNMKNIPCLITADVNAEEKLEGLITESTLGISISAEWIFKKNFIDRFKGRLVNLHGAKLPQGRGGGGWSWLIMMNQMSGGCTIHLIDPGIDTGDIVSQKKYNFPEGSKKPSIYGQYSTIQYCLILREFINDVEGNRDFELISQEEGISSYWPRLNTDINGFIDWNWSLCDIEAFINAFDDPYKGASSFINKQRVYIRNVFSHSADGPFHPFQAGLIYRKVDDGVFVAANQGSLVIREVKDGAGVSVFDQIRVGGRFYTPVHFLEKAMTNRAVYLAEKG